MSSFFFFFNDTATTEIYTLSLHDALPIATAPAPEPVRRGVFLAEAGGYDRTGSPRHTASASRLPPGVGGGEPRRVRRAGRDRGPVLDGPRRATPPRIPGRRH